MDVIPERPHLTKRKDTLKKVYIEDSKRPGGRVYVDIFQLVTVQDIDESIEGESDFAHHGVGRVSLG